MTTRKKATKKPLSRPAKVAKRPSKSSSSAKGKDAKIAKPLRPAKKAAAKVAKGAKVSSRAAPSKTARAQDQGRAFEIEPRRDLGKIVGKIVGQAESRCGAEDSKCGPRVGRRGESGRFAFKGA